MGVFYSLQHHTVTGSVISQTATKQDRTVKGIMQILVLCLAVSASAVPQGINFGETASTTKKPDIGQRLGLLANSLGLDPTGANNQGGEFGGQQCCCVPVNEQCGDPLGRDDLVGAGLIDPRLKDPTKAKKNDISIRIVNRPQASTNTNAQQNSCPVGQKACCYDRDIDLSIFGITCINPQQAHHTIPVDSTTCNRKLKAALNNQRRGVGDRFTLSPSEICAGAEVGKDACTGDGGSPLLCQAKSGRWTVMGL